MAITEEIKVTGIAEYKAAMSQAKQSVKTWDEELKRIDATLKTTGNQEQYVADKTKALQSRLAAQTTAVKQAEAALKSMRDQGVSQTSIEYQKMQQELSKAQTGMMQTTYALNQLKQGELEAAEGADKLTTSVNGISKKISLDQVIGGIDKITTGLESAAKKAVSLGQLIWDNIMQSAQWADDTATQAMMLDMNVEDYQKYKNVFDTIGELTIQDWAAAKRKVQDAIYSPSKEQTDILALLGIKTHETTPGKFGEIETAARDWEDIFWEVGSRLQELVASGSMTQGLADTYFEALFGKKYMNYLPLLKLGKEGFQEAVNSQEVASEEAVNKMAELNDKVLELKQQFTALETEVMSGLAPALTAGAEALSGLLEKLLEYLKTPEGQEMLESMGKAVEGLFEDLAKIDPEDVVEGFTGVFNSVVDGLKWLNENSGTVISAMEAIVIGWGALKITGGALTILQLVQGITGLGGGASAAAAAGTAAGTSWGSAFAAAVMKAAPWLIGLYTMLNPADTEDNSLVDSEGNLTAEGRMVQEQEQEQARLEEERNTRRANGTQTYDDWLLDMAQKYMGDYLAIAALYENFAFQAAQDYWDKYRTHTATTEDWQALNDAFGEGGDAGRAALLQIAKVMYSTDKAVEDLPKEAFGMYDNFEETPIIQIDPIPPEDAAEQIAEDVGDVVLPTTLFIHDIDANGFDIDPNDLIDGPGFANGLSFVPHNGLYKLHRGERVIPAREVNSHNYSSNLYVESMIMNNGTDANGLADRMAAAQRRQMSGYGSV